MNVLRSWPGCTAVQLLLASGLFAASDWPQLLGPSADAAYTGPALAETWPKEGPRVLWSAEVGQGYASPVVSGGRVIIAHRRDDDLIVDCLEAATGARRWTHSRPMKFKDGASFDHGPRPTPVIRHDRVVVLNTDGHLACLGLADGAKIWSREARSEFKSSATWHGVCASPLVTDKAVILPVGGTNNAGIVAFAADTGRTLWRVTDDKAAAATPVLAVLGGRTQALVVTRQALRSLDPETGAELWSHPTRKQSSGNVYCASPVVDGDRVFLSGWYRLGAELLRVPASGPPESLWQGDDALSTHYATAILREGHLYGFHGHAWENGGPALRCVALASGRVVWEQPKTGSGTILKCGPRLLILTDTGELQLAAADPRGFRILARAQVLGRNNRSYPAVADGIVYVRGQKKLVALDLRAAAAR